MRSREWEYHAYVWHSELGSMADVADNMHFATMNRLGWEGWELVAVIETSMGRMRYEFKRERRSTPGDG